jgi:hypothetical protein
MKKIIIPLLLVLITSCTTTSDKIPVYAWVSGPGDSTDEELLEYFTELKDYGVDGLMYSAGHNPDVYSRVGAIAAYADLEFHAWIPAMVQGKEGLVDYEFYGINGLGESAWDKPAYVNYYKFMCPNYIEVHEFLASLYGSIADVPEVDGIHLDYIRYPDVILARGLWDKYGLVMDKEYPQYDYCYCDKCVSDFKNEYGIDILAVEEPSELEEWKQFRYDLITELVNELAELVHSRDKSITAAVFPGPGSIAKKIVRQEWDLWNLDAFYPMNYNDFYLEDTDWIGEVCKEAVESINNSKPVYSGLFICPDPENKSTYADPENHGLIPSEIEEAIEQSINNGAAGICLFTPGRMTDKGWEALARAIKK